MRASAVQFLATFPGRKFRHEKPDLKILLERKESDYVDVAAVSWQNQKQRKRNHKSSKDLLLRRSWGLGLELSYSDSDYIIF